MFLGNRTGATTSLKCSQGMPINIIKEQALLGVFDLKSGWITYLNPHTIHWKINPLCSLFLSECMQRKYFVYTVKSEAGVNTAENVCSLHGFRQNLSGLFFSTMNIKAVEHLKEMHSVPLQAPACSLFFCSCMMLISLALEFIAWRKVVNTKKAD